MRDARVGQGTRGRVMLFTVIELLEIAVCCLIILLVMAQPGRGGLGPALGGGPMQQVFGTASATGRILRNVTAILALVFVLATIALAWLSSRRGRP